MVDIITGHILIELIVVVFLGLVLGSFSTAIIYRTRHKLSWIWNNKSTNKARSYCPSCQHVLGLRTLIPVFSWLFQRGRCYYCQTKISAEYLFVELSVLFVSLGLYLALGFSRVGLLSIFVSPFIISQIILALKYKLLSKLLLSIIFIGVLGIMFFSYFSLP